MFLSILSSVVSFSVQAKLRPDADCDIATTSLRVSLTCPVSYSTQRNRHVEFVELGIYHIKFQIKSFHDRPISNSFFEPVYGKCL